MNPYFLKLFVVQDHSDPEFNHDPEVCCEEQVTKTKKILSANNEAGFHGMIIWWTQNAISIWCHPEAVWFRTFP